MYLVWVWVDPRPSLKPQKDCCHPWSPLSPSPPCMQWLDYTVTQICDSVTLTLPRSQHKPEHKYAIGTSPNNKLKSSSALACVLQPVGMWLQLLDFLIYHLHTNCQEDYHWNSYQLLRRDILKCQDISKKNRTDSQSILGHLIHIVTGDYWPLAVRRHSFWKHNQKVTNIPHNLQLAHPSLAMPNPSSRSGMRWLDHRRS